jgi:hypothetical protein
MPARLILQREGRSYRDRKLQQPLASLDNVRIGLKNEEDWLCLTQRAMRSATPKKETVAQALRRAYFAEFVL